MRQNSRLTWSVALAVGIPVLALTGCPGLLGGTTPSPSPSASASATAAPTTTPTSAPTASPTASPAPTAAMVVLNKLALNTDGSVRTITLKNVGGTAADLTNWVVSYEAKSGTSNALAMVHARLVGASDATVSLATNESKDFSEAVSCTSGNCVKLESTLGSSVGVTKLGIQATHGSVVLYKGIASGAAISTGTMTDYLQYGNLTQGTNTGNYTHGPGAVTAGLWETATATSSAPGAVNASISRISATATGSTNWKKD